MMFRAKVDKYFLILIFAAIIILGLACLLPLFLDSQIDPLGMIIMLLIFILSAGFLIWISMSISYIFTQDYLLIKSGPIRKRILYSEITNVQPTKDILTGFRMLSSIDAIAISYQSGWMGEVKISPKDKDAFLRELKRREPRLK